MTINRKGAGIISSEGIMTNVTMDTTALEKDLGVKGVICFGGKPLLSESNTLYPSKLIQKDNKRNAEAYLRSIGKSLIARESEQIFGQAQIKSRCDGRRSYK